jgi:hypothetical protein
MRAGCQASSTKGKQVTATAPFTTATPAEITKAAVRDALADPDFFLKGRQWKTIVRSLCAHAYVEARRKHGMEIAECNELAKRIEVFFWSTEFEGRTNEQRLDHALNLLIRDGLPA